LTPYLIFVRGVVLTGVHDKAIVLLPTGCAITLVGATMPLPVANEPDVAVVLPQLLVDLTLK
jgi:hypothetical protein